MSKKVLFYVQHLMGVGHVFRAMRLVKAMTQAGLSVDLVYGGEPIPNLDAGDATVHFLPSLRAGTKVFREMVDANGRIADQAYRDARRDQLLSIFRSAAPDILMTEAFPFGRRQMFFELLPLLEAAAGSANRPVVACSVRDILQENRKPSRDRETVDLLKTYYDAVFVHGDPDFAQIEDTFPYYEEIADLVRYTGIVAPEPVTPEARASGEGFDVVVSVGGGLMGRELLFAAAEAKGLSSLDDKHWCFVTGINTAPEDVAHMETLLSGQVTVRKFLTSLPEILARSDLSVSRAGYNTVADVFTAGCRAVFVPLCDGEETEQIRRAEILSARGLAETVPPERANAAAIAAAIDRAAARNAPSAEALRLDGAATTARMLAEFDRTER